MATKLGLYQAAVREIGGTRVASLVEAREPRYVLDDVYDASLLFCLEQGSWNFAMRAVEFESDPGIDAAFGFEHAFEKPDDWIRTCSVSGADTFDPPLIHYTDENSYWWADVDPLYVRYISSHANYGLDLTRWPATFTRYVELYLARRICPTTTNSKTDIDRLDRALRHAKVDALSKDAMNEGPKFAPQGSWARSRGGAVSSRNPGRV